ncbi:Rho GTPase-activating protein [Trema orientale]|uniref:Rho GTPase-activating protein n=1 Tax=Trema orientale TaxID=63057 RepID=A0A2P5AVA3_TREOI|nr:Rho GTPase-activating protein [Trema orientale]
MTEVLQSPSHFPSTSSSSSTPCAPPTPNDGSNPRALISSPIVDERVQAHLGSDQEEEEEEEEEEEGGGEFDRKRIERDREGDQLSVVELLIAAFRKSLIGCSNTTQTGKLSSSSSSSAMEIGWPSNVRHVAHVTFDRFNGFLGLPVEFEPEVPRRPPSASANVFGVSTESMQLSFDSRGNSVPTILLLMQRHLYARGGLQAEGIFRINAENSQEEYVRDQLNRGLIPDGIDVHCLAGLIKAWFRELPTGLLDSISPEQIMQSQSEEECAQLVRLLPPTEAALLDWAINLMADVAQFEHLNKMNARNVAMVFAPNMTHMADPLTALMYAVQVMNFLKTLIVKTLRDREDSVVETSSEARLEPDDDGHQSASHQCLEDAKEETEAENEGAKVFVPEEPALDSPCQSTQDESTTTGDGSQTFLSSIENIIPGRNRSLVDSCPCEVVSQVSSLPNGLQDGSTGHSGDAPKNTHKSKTGQSSTSSLKKGSKKLNEQIIVQSARSTEKSKKAGILGRINSRKELVEAWLSVVSFLHPSPSLSSGQSSRAFPSLSLARSHSYSLSLSLYLSLAFNLTALPSRCHLPLVHAQLPSSTSSTPAPFTLAQLSTPSAPGPAPARSKPSTVELRLATSDQAARRCLALLLWLSTSLLATSLLCHRLA